MASSIVTPPIRVPLLEKGGHEPTAKTAVRDWWLYWESLTRRTNRNATDIGAIAQELANSLQYGTHAERLAAAPDPAGALWIETDRGNVIYQAQTLPVPAWIYVAGVMVGPLASRPADLGAADGGFLFQTTDTGQSFRWAGGAWVETTAAANTFEYLIGQGVQTVTTSPVLVTGMSMNLERAGRYAIRAIFDFSITGAGDAGASMVGQFFVGGAALPGPVALFQNLNAGAAGSRATVVVENVYVAASPGVVLQAAVSKNTGTGTSQCFGSNSTLSATWIAL